MGFENNPIIRRKYIPANMVRLPLKENVRNREQ